MPGPNDSHVVFVEVEGEDGRKTKVPTLEPGLGNDEPPEGMRAGARAAAAKQLEQQRKELAESGEALDSKSRALMAKEEALLQREANLDAKARDQAAREEAFQRAVTAAEHAGQ